MISLKRIIEQQGATGQLYDLGKDFANFRRTVDGSFDQIKARFEHVIGEKLKGKRIRARASRGYKQYLKDYEFDVAKITLDDYYDNYVVVAHDNSSSKPKEYFLNPGFKIQILGPATNTAESPSPAAPVSPDKAQSQPMMPAQPRQQVKENDKIQADAYSIESIIKDVEPWMNKLLKKPDDTLRDFVKGLGWTKDGISLFELVLPVSHMKVKPTKEILSKLVQTANSPEHSYAVKHIKENEDAETVIVQIKKSTNKAI